MGKLVINNFEPIDANAPEPRSQKQVIHKENRSRGNEVELQI